MLNANATNPSDMNKLYRQYSSAEPPPVELIQSRDVFDLLIRDLFNSTKNIDPRYKSKDICILAYTSTIREEFQYPNEKEEEDNVTDDNRYPNQVQQHRNHYTSFNPNSTNLCHDLFLPTQFKSNRH
jgi:hypothetical protein